MIRKGSHNLEFWSKTQSVIALSSGESELYATVKASAEGLSVMATDRDLKETYHGKVWADAITTLGVIQRMRLGKGRHIDTHHLWKNPAAAHRDLEREWIGTTTFIRSSPGSKSIGAAATAPAADGSEIMPRGG